MKDNEQNVFDWASEQLLLNSEQNVYKGCIENQRQDYNIKCLEILTDAIKRFPNQTFIEILLNYGLLDTNIHEESNSTLGSMRICKRQFEKCGLKSRWDKLGFCEGLHGEINKTISALYECNE